MSNPYAPYERRVLATVADPLSTELQHAFELDEAWDQGYAAAISDRRWRRLELLLATTAGAVLGFMLAAAVVHAAPRSAETAIPTAPRAAVSTAERTGPASGNPSRQTGAPPAGHAQTAGPVPGSDPSTPGGAPITEPAAIAGGLASWYDDGPGLYAAVPTWSFGDRPYRVRVIAGDRSVVVSVRDFCGCPGARIIDLSPEAFARLAPLSRGLIPVTVEDVGPGVTPPPTSTEVRP